MLTSDEQGLIDVLHEAETFGTRLLILEGSTASSSHKPDELLFNNGTCKLQKFCMSNQ